MARRRRGDGDPAEPTLEQPAGDGQPQIEVRMRGGADDVKKQLGVAVETKPEKPAEADHDEEKKKFVDSLRNPKFIIRVKRVTPREHNGVKTNVEVWSSELPLSYQEIQEEVAKAYMGGKYRVAVVDPNSNSTIAADTFEVGGDPNIPESEASQEELDRILMRGQPKDAAALTEEGLDRRARVSAKMLEVEALESQLEDARNRRKRPEDTSGSARDTKVEELERRMIEAKHQVELEARDRKHAEEMRELKALISQSAKPAKENDSMTILLEQMRADRKASDDRFNAMMRQMQDEKMTALLDEVKSIKNKPQTQGASLLDQAEAILKLKRVFGWGEDDDDDDDDDIDDKRPWWERALDKLGGKFGDKLLAKFTDMEEKGQTVDRETFMKGMSEYADQVADEAVSRKTSPPPGKTHALPPPSQAPIQQLPPPPAAPSQPSPVSQLPPPPPASASVPAPVLPKTMTVQEEIALRTSGVLEMLAREIELRPNEYLWNYEGAWQSLPEPILEKVCAAADPSGVVDALVIDGVIDPAKVAELKAKIVSNPRILAWVAQGLSELKEWWAAKQQDPSFEPFADEDDGGEEATGS